MGVKRVKLKLPVSAAPALILTALATFLASSAGWFPADLVESWYADMIFPVVSAGMGVISDTVGFALLDLILPFALAASVYLIYRRRWLQLGGLTAAAYLFFFWTWGLNYHRAPLVSKLAFAEERLTEDGVARLAEEAARELNLLHGSGHVASMVDESFRREAAARVSRVTRELDAARWDAASRVKVSVLLNPFFRASGTLGMFNPFGHEAVVTDGLLPFEQPMTALHELAHVRGYPNEGDANFIALVAAVTSADPAFRYSGWLSLWQYLASSERNELLDEGPRQDLQAIARRRLEDEIRWVRRTGTRALDAYLRANRVEGGIRSYSRMVALAVGTRPSWDRFAGP